MDSLLTNALPEVGAVHLCIPLPGGEYRAEYREDTQGKQESKVNQGVLYRVCSGHGLMTALLK